MTKRHRSPSYPSFTLTKSVERAIKFYHEEGKHAAPIGAALKHWGYALKSSGGLMTISSLKAFGLMQDTGASSDRVVSLTDEGLAIVQDERTESPERAALLKQAAIMPKIIADLVAQYPDKKPSDETLRFYLVQRDYNPNAVSDIIKVYKDAINYINLSPENEGDGEHAFITENSTGMPAAEDEVVKYNESDGDREKTPLVNPLHTGLVKPPVGANMRQETFTLEGQGEILIQFPSTMTKEDFEDFTDYLDILKRKVGRSVIKESEQAQNAEKAQQD